MDVGSCTIYELSGTSQGFPLTPGCMRSSAPSCGRPEAQDSTGGSTRCSAGSFGLELRTGPGGVSAVSKRTVTTPEPEPQTQPGPIASCTTSAPGGQVRRGGSGSERPRRPPRRPSRRRGPPGPSRPARTPRPPAAVCRRWCRGRSAGSGRSGRSSRRRRSGWTASPAAQRCEVVQPDLDRDRPPREAVLAHPGADVLGLGGSGAPPSSRRSVRSLS